VGRHAAAELTGAAVLCGGVQRGGS
jgi:hypothetical protein